jgi:hypothetical protein
MLAPEIPAPLPRTLSKNEISPADPSSAPTGSPVKADSLRRTPTSSATKSSSSKLRRTKTLGAKSTMDRSPGELADELALDRPKSPLDKRGKSHHAESRPSVRDGDVVDVVNCVEHNMVAERAENDALDIPADEAKKSFRASPESGKQPVRHISQSAAPEMQKAKLKHSGDEAPMLDSDDLVIGLPKEQYKPRPSRSRSSRIAEDPSIDYSVRPERATKAKRRKTVNDFTLGSPSAKTDAEKMAQIGSMGFTPRQTKTALIETSGNVERAIEHLITHSTHGKENSPSKPSKSRSKSKKESKVPTSHSEFVGVEVTPVGTVRDVDPLAEPDNLQHNIPKKQEDPGHEISLEADTLTEQQPKDEGVSAKRPSTQKRRRDTVVNSDDDDEDVLAEHESPNPVLKPAAKRTKLLPKQSNQEQGMSTEALTTTTQVTTKPAREPKRGRGRPRKVVENAVDAEPEHEFTESDTGDQDTNKVVHSETSAKSKELVPKREAPNDKTQAPSSTPKNGASPPSTPEQNADSTTQTSQKSGATKPVTQHSPLNKSKVPLRVGLSKKTRIAPLLRIIKK